MGLKESHTDSNTQKEPGIGHLENIKRRGGQAIEAQKSIKRAINSLPPYSLKKLLGKKSVNPYVQGKN